MGRMGQTAQTGGKRKSSEYASDDGFIAEDSDDLDRPTKRSKPATTTTSSQFAAASVAQFDDDGNEYWELSKSRRVTVSQFKGKYMVGIREYYEQNGKTLPGKKGISLPIDQYSALVELLPQIESSLQKKGENIPRPSYGGSSNGLGTENDMDPPEEEVEVDDADADEEQNKPKKSNIEATSDEDEN